MAIDMVRGYGMIPYGYGLYGYGLTLTGENDGEIAPLTVNATPQPLAGSAGVSAAIVPLTVNATPQPLAGSAGVSAAIVPAEVVVTGADVRGLVPAGTLTFRTKVEHG